METKRQKLKLNLNDLKVESFDTTPDMSKVTNGTVHGYDTLLPECATKTPWETDCCTGLCF